MSSDRNAGNDKRQLRSFQRQTSSGGAADGTTIIVNSGGALAVNVGNGLTSAGTNLGLNLTTNGGLKFTSATVGIAVNGTSLALAAGGLSVALATNSGLQIATGVKLLLDTNPGLVLAATGVKVLLAGTPGLALAAGGLSVLLAPSANLTSGATGLDINPTYTGTLSFSTGDVKLLQAGKGIFIKEGANAKMGVATLVGGTVVVSTTAVTASSRILLSAQTASGTQGWLSITALTPATSFTITSTSILETSSVLWVILEPA